ncbi:MAG: RNA methyltransferase [Nocardioidaceae bacterium]|nr:RNA methyltransferase [Nocardioidaceae bacterium]
MTPLAAGNARVKEARKLSRRSVRTERRLFLVEGWKAVAEAAAIPGCVVEVFATPAAHEEHAALLDGLTVHLVDERAAASLSGAVTPQGLVAVCGFLDVPLAEALAAPGPGPIAVCADVRDPGNAGTIIRTADAAGARAVVLAGHSVDPYNDKTVRATVGSLFHLPVALAPDPAAVVLAAQRAGYAVLAADGTGETGLFAADDLLAGDVAWLLGNEAWGLPAELAGLADHRVAIPLLGRAESLNLATAAAVCLYASARVRPTLGS